MLVFYFFFISFFFLPYDSEMSEKTAKIDAIKRKKVNHKGIQTTEEKIQIAAEDLTSEGNYARSRLFHRITFFRVSKTLCAIFSAGPSENYWQVLAERRRVALEDALEENSVLTERISKLEEENRVCKEMLDETRALVEVLQVR